MYTDTDIKYVDPNSIRQHLVNIQIYGEHIKDSFVENIKEYGIRVPLVVCRSSNEKLDNLVVCGRRRMLAARKLGIKVPVRFWDCEDDLEIEERLILDNIRNPSTNEEKIRMYAHLKKITEERAKRNQTFGVLAGESPVDSRAEAAKKLGISTKTAQRGSRAITKADELRASGDEEGANEIISALNKSVASADRKTKPDKDEIETTINSLESTAKKADGLRASLVGMFDRRYDEDVAAKFKKFESLGRALGDIIDTLEDHMGIIRKAWETL